MLAAILVTLLLNLFLYLIYFKGLFDNYPLLVPLVRLIELPPPLAIWLYATAVLSGTVVLNRKTFIHAIPFVIFVLLMVPLVIRSFSETFISADLQNYNKIYSLVLSFVVAASFIFYGQTVIRKLFNIEGQKAKFKELLFDYSQNQLILVKVLVIMMHIYGLLVLASGIGHFMTESYPTVFDYIDTVFLVVLSYMLIFIFTTSPKVIHYKFIKNNKDDSLHYEKSGLTRSEAISYMKGMNDWMNTERPYLRSDLSLGELAEQHNLPIHIVSEVLNGLFKQNFYEYVNNFRIEEFKRLAKSDVHKKETNLNLAFSCGFNSKTTFNTSFKKFTGQTPSEFRKSIG